MRVEAVDAMRDIAGTAICILSDVTNPLTGRTGAAPVFGPQNGALSGQVAHLDAQMGRWADGPMGW